MATRYHITLPDAARARDAGEFAFRSQGAEGLAAELQEALRSDALFRRWRDAQTDPDAVDPALGAIDPAATVRGESDDLHVDLIVVTAIPGSVFKHRLRLLAGQHWQLRDVRAA